MNEDQSSEFTALTGRCVRLEDFEAAALPHFDELYRAALRVIGDRAEAEDLVQETYLEGWKSFHRFELGTNCRAWLFKILFHVVHHQRRKRCSLNLSGDEILEEVLTHEPPIPEQLTDEDILLALDRLPVEFREVVLLVDVEEFAYKQVAEALMIPVGTVMSRLSRGRKLLRAQLWGLAASCGIKVKEAVPQL